MPIFDFECEVCGEQVEEFQKLDEESPNCCKDPTHGKMKKLISKVSIRMGGGLYSWDKNDPDKFGEMD